MGIKVYNTLTGKKEEFNPDDKKNVKIYACGITVYDACHIGHARQAIVYDVISKYLKYRGYGVTYVRNYTDVDDKIIARANSENRDALEYSNQKITEAEKDLEQLGISDADVSPRVSENIDTIIDFTKGLIDKGYAYATNGGDVYFSVKNFPNYGKLSNRNINELEHGVRKDIEPGKKDPLDFALWKSAKEGEVSWTSPWGGGRPGWHIECSAMSMKYLGETFDIHGGGKDLIFPHHENEIAQSEALTGKPLANYWIHNGLVTVDGQKMSKSLGNSITIKDTLERYHPEVVRFSMLLNHYSSNVDMGFDAMDASEKRLYYLYKTLDQVNKFTVSNKSEGGKCLNPDMVKDIEKSFVNAMDDDFNTSLAISNLSPVFKYANDLLKKNKESLEDRAATLKSIVEMVLEITQPLGMLRDDPERFLSVTRAKYIKQKNLDTSQIDKLVNERLQAKQRKDYASADAIRKQLDEQGVIIQDSGEYSEWDIKDLYTNLDVQQKKTSNIQSQEQNKQLIDCNRILDRHKSNNRGVSRV